MDKEKYDCLVDSLKKGAPLSSGVLESMKEFEQSLLEPRGDSDLKEKFKQFLWDYAMGKFNTEKMNLEEQMYFKADRLIALIQLKRASIPAGGVVPKGDEDGLLTKGEINRIASPNAELGTIIPNLLKAQQALTKSQNICPKCKGSGLEKKDAYQTCCDPCKGTGRVEPQIEGLTEGKG